MQTTDCMCKFSSLWHSAGPLAFGLQAPKQGLFKAGCDDEAGDHEDDDDDGHRDEDDVMREKGRGD